MSERRATESEPLTAVVGALPEEVAPLWQRLARGLIAVGDRDRDDDHNGGGGAAVMRDAGSPPLLTAGRLMRGRIGRHPVVIAVSGDGDGNARAVAAEILHAYPVGRLISIGVAGALSLGLPPLALVIADDVRQVGGGLFRSPPELVEWAARTCGARRARVVTAPTGVDTPADKAALDHRYGQGAAAVVDLESSACAGAAEAAGIPWLVLRTVVDAADESIPPLLNRCRDDRGGIRRGRVAGALLRNPRSLPRLLELRRRVATSAEVLARAVQSLLDAWPETASGGVRPRTRNMKELL